LTELGYRVSVTGSTIEVGEALIRPEEPFGKAFATQGFKADTAYDAKKKIGRLVAEYLAKPELQEKMSVFLGSGSSVFHIGGAMCEIAESFRSQDKKSPYEQNYVTVNIPLAAYWSMQLHPPVKEVTLPGGEIDTDQFRFVRQKDPSRPSAMVVFGADGVYYNPELGTVTLYANSEAIAAITNHYTRTASHSVICCLSSDKMDTRGRNQGPPIVLPGHHVGRVLVTNQALEKNIGDAFARGGWSIVTDERGWGNLRPLRDFVPEKPKVDAETGEPQDNST
jgi:DeoR/GlpR family transcriptional regulator of sugar metabolism